MDKMQEAITALTADGRDLARVAYLRALLVASDAVARLTDGDSEIHDQAIAEACRVIEALPLPECLK